ncbi:hypothetical protein O181_061725 [Austropuccinia psidii MF-1]|uniref:GAG-pre-integrase domain-containing protein n=1 Tax=Austropuccinia psidii MF-1 TaxID=1389203 RepID=A0A9Q3I0R2_9BASI|nr:hypothetical protein [Austropuccinia psidii MF-1]
MATLRIPVKGGNIIIRDVTYSNRVLGTILSMGILCRAGVFTFFSGMLLSLIVCHHLVTTTFHNDCWWMDTFAGGGTTRLAAETPSPRFFEMNPFSLPPTSKLSFCNWNMRLGHASDKLVLSFLKQHVPTFEQKTWKTFYCEVCAKSKSTHLLARAHVNIPTKEPLDLLVSNIMGPFEIDSRGFRYLLTIWDHALTFSVVYPPKSR